MLSSKYKINLKNSNDKWILHLKSVIKDILKLPISLTSHILHFFYIKITAFTYSSVTKFNILNFWIISETKRKHIE